jgi:hypothetical protein
MSVFALSFAVILLFGPPAVITEDLENAFQSLTEAVSKKAAAEVKSLAAETCALARQLESVRAREIELYTEYALYATALASPPAATVDLLAALERQNPKSRYLDEAYGSYLLALHQTGAASKIPALAEKAISNFPNNEDLLLVLADTALSRKQSDRALQYAERLVATLYKHPKPEGMSAADWERKRSAALGRGHWIAGLLHAEKAQYYEADKDLRSALPLIKGNEAMLAPALFHLGVVNYELGRTTMRKARVLEAAAFSEQAAALGGPLGRQAWLNALVMKTEAGKMR